ncbi:carbohydrate ABC transporter permease [Paenibacillus cymbidii]|uniref:carbohydrate ABC transporter permease n=1 Tax=Paenibacillus cymbidii TaxID=1639034 RepID=UPI001080504D|nr:carbohydrate ABC transporter permease [Paenibacillus cymbidii]
MATRQWDAFTVVNSLFMLVLVFVMLYPFVYMINVSLSSELYVMKNQVSFWPKGWTWSWYRIVLHDSRLGIGYRNTIVYTALGTFISLAATSMGAYALSRRRMVLRKSLTLAIVFTILFSGGMIPSYLVAKELGILNSIWAMVLPGAVSAYNLLIFRAFFEGLPEELFDAGQIDGLHDMSLFARIVVPLSKPVYAAIGLFVAVGIWNNFYNALIYLRDANLFPLQSVLRDLVISGSLANEAVSRSATRGETNVVVSIKYATIIVSTLPILLLYPFLQKYFVKGVLIGSVKG